MNGYNKRTYFLIDVSRFLHIPTRIIRKLINVFEVKELYVKRLSKIVKRTEAKVIMSSSWRGGFWNVSYEEKWEDQKRLTDLLNKYNIEVIGITPSSHTGIRQDEIQEWLNTTDIKVESFVILDDESFDLQKFVGNHLVKTSKVIEGDMICGRAYEDTGLKRKHVRQAIKILNSKGE